MKVTRRLGLDGRLIPGEEDLVDEGEWDIEVEFTEVRGRLRPTRLELQPGVFHEGLPTGGITARLLHAIKLGELVDEFNQEHDDRRAAEALFFGKVAKPKYQLPPRTNRPGPKGLGEAFYQDVAVHYLKAVRTDPRRPIAAMTPAYRRCSRDNVRYWVDRARQKGYLTSPGQGFPGGEPTEKLLEALRGRGVPAPGGKKSALGRSGRRRSTPRGG